MADEAIDLHEALVLLVDDTPANLDVLCALLEGEGYKLALASDGPLALKIAQRRPPELILLDIVMPGIDGYEVCRRLKQEPALQRIPVIFITARDQPGDILAGFQAGGVDYITKPFREAEVLARIRTHVKLQRQQQALALKNCQLEAEIARRQRLSGQLARISARDTQRWGLAGFVGKSPTMQHIFETIRLAQEYAVAPVLITGESGTGKELIARAIHFGSDRRAGPFVPLNCAAIPAELADSELFGHVKGAFTGAQDDRVGCFEMAHEGTLFLDELGELPMNQQAKLLRVLEDGQVRRVGDRVDRPVDVRVVAATNASLRARIQAGTFREDLYYRLARLTVEAPPLRQRPEDIPLLANHFLQLFATEMGVEPPPLTPALVLELQSYPFPGNVRELKNVIERALLESRGGPLTLPSLRSQADEADDGGPLDDNETPPAEGILTLAELEKRHIERVLQATAGVIYGPEGAAQLLDIHPDTLRSRMRKLGIRRPS